MTKKFLLPLLSIALVLGLVGEVSAQALLSPGVSASTFTAATGTAVAGTPYALTQGYSPTVSWTIITVGGPSAITVSLQGSQDNLAWFDLDVSTNTAGELRYLNPIALKFVRGYITTRTGGTNISISLLANRGFNNVASGGLLTTGISVPAACTDGMYGYTFNADNDTKLCSDAANTVKIKTGGITRATINSTGLDITGTIVGNSTITGTNHVAGAGNALLWAGRSQMASPSDGVIGIYNNALTDFTRLQFGGTTNSFPSLKRNSTTVDFRFADDSGYSPIHAGIIYTEGNFGHFSRGYFNWSADGIVALTDNAGTSFNRLQFGGITSAFPALKRSSTVLQVRLADDSGNAGITAASFQPNGRSIIQEGGADGTVLMTDAAGTSFNRLMFGGSTSSFPSLKRSSTVLQARLADDSGYTAIETKSIYSEDAGITVGSGTGISVDVVGKIQDQIYKVTVARTNFIAAAVTADVTIATLPAKTRLQSFYADVTQVFACGSVCTSTTLSMTCGSAAGGNTILLTFDIDAALIQRGLADADLGTDLTRATAIQGGKMYSWSATQIITCRLTSGTGNIGTGAATNLSTGSITFYLQTVRLP